MTDDADPTPHNSESSRGLKGDGPPTVASAHATDYVEFRYLMGAFACTTFCTRILFFWVPFELANRYPHDPLFLGMLGLVQAIPALSLAIVGGHLADSFNRRNLLRTTISMQLVACVGLMVSSWFAGGWLLAWIYAFMFVLGVARGFAEPTMPSLEAQIVPRIAAMNAATWGTLVWHACAVLAPLLAGLLIRYIGSNAAFLVSILCGIAALVFVSAIGHKPPPRKANAEDETVLQSLTAGWRFVFGKQILWNAMALDLFAVLFGGAIAMLPLFAKQILHVGPIGLGFLNAAPMMGALSSAWICMRYPPKSHAGVKLLASVFGFGLCMIVFALSTNVVLSCVALYASGVLDGISVVIRKSILRLYSPDHMRGRVAAVSSVFIGASNEVGELESGVAAHYLGLVRSVWMGGIATLMVVAAVGGFGRELRQFDMEKDQRRREPT